MVGRSKVAPRYELIDDRCPTLCLVYGLRDLGLRLARDRVAHEAGAVPDHPKMDVRKLASAAAHLRCLLVVGTLSGSDIHSDQPQTYYQLRLVGTDVPVGAGDARYAALLSGKKPRALALMPLGGSHSREVPTPRPQLADAAGASDTDVLQHGSAVALHAVYEAGASEKPSSSSSNSSSSSSSSTAGSNAEEGDGRRQRLPPPESVGRGSARNTSQGARTGSGWSAVPAQDAPNDANCPSATVLALATLRSWRTLPCGKSVLANTLAQTSTSDAASQAATK